MGRDEKKQKKKLTPPRILSNCPRMSATLTFVDAADHLIETEIEINLSNSNARHFLGAVGMNPDFEEAPILSLIQFRSMLSSYLRANLGKTEDAVETVEIAPNFYDCGRSEDYVSTRALAAIKACHEAEEKGAVKAYFS